MLFLSPYSLIENTVVAAELDSYPCNHCYPDPSFVF